MPVPEMLVLTHIFLSVSYGICFTFVFSFYLIYCFLVYKDYGCWGSFCSCK